jgi:DNA polymerase-3 subunit epsilon
MENIILVVDIETTGFLNQGGLIIEIGIVKLNLENGEISPAFNSLIREPT